MVHMDVTVCWKYLFIALVSIVSDKCCKSNNKNIQSITFCDFFAIKIQKASKKARNMHNLRLTLSHFPYLFSVYPFILF